RLRGFGVARCHSATSQPRNSATSHSVQLQLLEILRSQRLLHALLDPLAVPNLEVIGVAEDDDVFLNAGVLAEHGGNEYASLRIDRRDLAEVVHALEQLRLRDGSRRHFREARVKVVPDGHRINERVMSVFRRDEAVLPVFLFNDLAESGRDLETTLLVD